jgi:predicted GNAT family acetyltransferase
MTHAHFIEPMPCLAVKKLPEGEGWQYELKLDGYRALAVNCTHARRFGASRAFSEERPCFEVSSYDCSKRHLIVMWEIFRKPQPQKVTNGRFEIERNGEVAYLEYSLSGNILELTHTEVPKKLRHMGLASSLAENALDWAREHNLKVDIVCSTVREYVAKHPEYSDLVMH